MSGRCQKSPVALVPQEWRRDERMLRAWQKGQTGFPLVDAGMRQLWATGWMQQVKPCTLLVTSNVVRLKPSMNFVLSKLNLPLSPSRKHRCVSRAQEAPCSSLSYKSTRPTIGRKC